MIPDTVFSSPVASDACRTVASVPSVVSVPFGVMLPPLIPRGTPGVITRSRTRAASKSPIKPSVAVKSARAKKQGAPTTASKSPIKPGAAVTSARSKKKGASTTKKTVAPDGKKNTCGTSQPATKKEPKNGKTDSVLGKQKSSIGYSKETTSGDDSDDSNKPAAKKLKESPVKPDQSSTYDVTPSESKNSTSKNNASPPCSSGKPDPSA